MKRTPSIRPLATAIAARIGGTVRGRVIRAAFCRIDLIDRAGVGLVGIISRPPGTPASMHHFHLKGWEADPEQIADLVAEFAREACGS
jgi:hypothetical protein